MTPRETYERIINSITDMDTRKLAREMSYHVGKDNRITKAELIIFMFGKVSDTNDRKVRLIVSDLVTNYHYPICTLSGVGGYWLAETRDEAIESAQDIESRIPDMVDRAKALRMCDLPAVLPEQRAAALQGSLL